MVTLFESASHRERLDAATAFLEAGPDAGPVLVIAASREAADDFVRASALKRGATFGLHRFSLMQLAARLSASDLASRGLAPATPLGVEAVTTRATFRALQAEALDYFAPIARYPGFARAAARTIAELRLEQVPASDVSSVAGCGPDLAELLQRFEDERRAAAVADAVVTLDSATKAIRQSAVTLPADRVLFLDVAIRGRAERELVGAIAQAATGVLFTIPTGDARTSQAIDMLGQVRREQIPVGDESDLGRLRANLFSPVHALSADRGQVAQTAEQVIFFSAPGEAREAVEIARRLLGEARAGVPLDHMAVLLRAPTIQAPLLDTALRRAGIPAYFARGARRPDPAGRAFLALLACAAERLSARRFAEYLSLGQIPDLDAGGAPPSKADAWSPPLDPNLEAAKNAATRSGAVIQALLPFDAPDPGAEPTPAVVSTEAPALIGTLRAPRRWEHLIVEAAVIGGKDRWRRRLDGLEAEYRLKLETTRAREIDSPRIGGLERDLANLDHLRRFALPIIDALADLPQEAAWSEWLDALNRLAPMAVRRSERILAVLAELRPLGIVAPVSFEEVREVLLRRLSWLEDEPPASRFGRVFVATPEQVRGRSFDVVFVPGLAERTFPQKTREDPILLDRARREIPDANLRTSDARIDEERLLLRLAAGAASTRLHLSYPRMGLELGESRPRVPSFYALDVLQATEGRIPPIDEFERHAAEESGARLAWPAPSKPALAIDDFEHDLSVLGPLLTGRFRPADKGRARYLLELNPHLGRSLRSRFARWESRWSAYDGLIHANDTTRAVLDRYRLTSRSYSVSALQNYAACPFRFLLAGIFKLDPREDPVALEQIDPLTRGKIFHQIQSEFMRELESTGLLPLESDWRLYSATLDAVVDRIASAWRDELAPAIGRVWDDGIESMRMDLHVWLQLMVWTASEWEPIRFEFGFGMPPDTARDPRSVPDPAALGPFKLHGIVDLIERRRDTGVLRITDYKTGRNDRNDRVLVGGGEILQPVLYSLAIESSLATPVAAARLMFCTSRGGFTERSLPLDENARAEGHRVLQVIDEAIAAGRLAAAPREGACTYCEFLTVCGPDEEKRGKRKEKAPLEALLRLRELP